MRTCLNCKAEFEVEKKRGRPHTKCESCRAKPKSATTLGSGTGGAPDNAVSREPKRKFKDEPTKGNARYSRQAFLDYMEENGVPIGAKAVAEAIRIVKEG